MAGLIVLVVLVLIALAGTVHLVRSRNRDAYMTEAEFEKAAQRKSALGLALLELQRITSAGDRVEYLLQRDKHVPAERTDAGELPPDTHVDAPRM
jgi:uncharacterized membrane protein